MKKVAIYYQVVNRNDGNPLYVWNCLKRDYKDIIEVHHYSPKEDVLKIADQFDLHINVDWGEDVVEKMLPYKMIDIPHPNAYWISDAHLGYEYRMNKAKKFDYVFIAQEWFREKLVADGIAPEKIFYLPHAVEPQAYPNKPLIIKKYDVGFVGHVNNEKRKDYLDKLFREIENFNFDYGIAFEDVAYQYRQTKVNFNVHINDDVNMRDFEVMGTGSFLLTERIPELEKLFTDKVHCVMYDSIEDCIEKAKYYIEHSEEREKIAKAGMEETLKNHTIKNRVDTILKTTKIIN